MQCLGFQIGLEPLLLILSSLCLIKQKCHKNNLEKGTSSQILEEGGFQGHEAPWGRKTIFWWVLYSGMYIAFQRRKHRALASLTSHSDYYVIKSKDYKYKVKCNMKLNNFEVINLIQTQWSLC